MTDGEQERSVCQRPRVTVGVSISVVYKGSPPETFSPLHTRCSSTATHANFFFQEIISEFLLVVDFGVDYYIPKIYL